MLWILCPLLSHISICTGYPIIECSRDSAIFDQFALDIFNSINCNPDDMRTRHDAIVDSGFNKRMKLMNAHDSKPRRGSRPT